MGMKYEIDDTLFDYIDSSWKAYYLGWIWTDGTLSQERNAIHLKISVKDKEILDYFNLKIFQGKRKLVVEKPRKFISPTNGKEYTSSEILHFSMINKRIMQNFLKLGLIENKSFDIQLPKISSHISHFIRGVFEGDGSVSFTKDKRMRATIFSASSTFSKQISEILTLNEVKNNIYLYKNIYRINIQGYKPIKKFYEFIYTDADFWLNRKREIFNEYFEYKEPKVLKRNTEKGIWFNKSKGTWTLMSKNKRLGVFPSKQEAIDKKREILNQASLTLSV